MAIYVTQYGYFWKLSETQWVRAIKWALYGFDFDYGQITKSLSRRPSVIAQSEDGSFYTVSNAHTLHRPLDWSMSDWISAAYDAGVLRHRDRTAMIETSLDRYESADGWTMARDANREWTLQSRDGSQIGRSESHRNDLVDRHKLELLDRENAG